MSDVKRNAPRGAVTAGLAALLCVIFLQMFFLARANSATWDEPDHTYTAYLQWKHGDFGLNPEHPPLVKFLAALPLLRMPLALPPQEGRTYRLEEAVGGREFFLGNDADAILFRARMATSVLTLFLALLVFLMAREMFGTGAGFLALGLIAFDPNLLANSALVTTDVGQACFMLWAIYALYRYVNQPSRWRLAALGLIVGLALATKHSTVLLFPMLLLLMGVELWRRRRVSEEMKASALRYTIAVCAVCLLALLVLWSWYGFRYSARPAGAVLNPSLADQFTRVKSPLEAGALRAAARLHLLPESYLYGFAHVLYQVNIFPSFLLGRAYPHGVPFFFPVALAIKSTLTFLLLLGITAWAVLTGRVQRQRELLYCALPALLYLAFAMSGGSNIGIRYLLPFYIFFSVAIGGAVWQLAQRDRRWLLAACVLLVLQVVSVARAFPAYVSYANEAAGGPGKVHLYLSDSSADWGQQLKSVKRYLDDHGIRDCWFAYFGDGVVDPASYGIPCKPLITADSMYFGKPHDMPAAIDGPVLISTAVLSGFEFGPAPLNPYEQFKALKPTAEIDYGVFVYDGHFAIPLAAAMSHVQKAGVLLAAKQVLQAKTEAEAAVALAPDSAQVNATMGEVLSAAGERAQSRSFNERALALAKAQQPAFQQGLIRSLTESLQP